MSRAFAAAAVLALLVDAAVPRAQEVSPPGLRFDVASVKPNRTGDQPPRALMLAPDGARVINLPLVTILWMSHRVQADQLVEVPPWARSESFDIIGKAPPGVPLTMDNIGAMLRDVLADRFQLKTRREQREMSVYALVQVKPGVTGPQLTRAAADCTAGGPRGTAPPPPPSLDGPSPCGATGRPGRMTIRGFPLVTLGRLVGPIVGRVVVDRTGLDGAWDVDLEFTPEQSINPIAGGPPAPASTPSDSPSLFTALPEQLGLKLESTRAPVEVIVVERLERPSPD